MMHKLTPKEINKVIHLTEEGLSARAIAEKTGISVYNIYQARKRNDVKSAAKSQTPEKTFKRNKKMFDLTERGLSAQKIAEKFDVSKATVYAAVHHYKAKLNKGGELNGNYDHGPDNAGSTTKKPASTEVLAGIAFAETNRLLTNLSKGTEKSPDHLRRRLSELLADTTLG